MSYDPADMVRAFAQSPDRSTRAAAEARLLGGPAPWPAVPVAVHPGPARRDPMDHATHPATPRTQEPPVPADPLADLLTGVVAARHDAACEHQLVDGQASDGCRCTERARPTAPALAAGGQPVATGDPADDAQLVEEVARWMAGTIAWEHEPESRDEHREDARRLLVLPTVAARLATQQLAAPPPHWTIDDVLRDQHARYHDQAGNLLGRDDCEWERCEFWDAAQHLADAGLLHPPVAVAP